MAEFGEGAEEGELINAVANAAGPKSKVKSAETNQSLPLSVFRVFCDSAVKNLIREIRGQTARGLKIEGRWRMRDMGYGRGARTKCRRPFGSREFLRLRFLSIPKIRLRR
jgi:hypothetical protein